MPDFSKDRDRPIKPVNQMAWKKCRALSAGKVCHNPFHKIHRKNSGITYWSDGKKQKGW